MITEQEFLTVSARFLAQVHTDFQANFQVTDHADITGHRYPLFAAYHSEDTHSLLFAGGKHAVSYEFCCFDTCPVLDEERLAFYEQQLEAMAAQLVPWNEASHSFSMLSIVVLTAAPLDKTLTRRLQKIQCEHKQTRKDPGFGWCTGRLCVVDLSTRTCRCNRFGKDLMCRTQAQLKRLRT